MTLSIIIPAHNEEEQIEATVRGVLHAVTTPCEVIVVADHCTDRTEDIVKKIASDDARLRLVRNDQRRGSFSNAIITGLSAAIGEAVVPVMADHCDDPATIERMWQAMQEKNTDVICASRYMKGGRKSGGPVIQNILSRIVSYSLHVLTRIPTWDCANSYKMYRRAFLLSLPYDIPDAGTEYSMALLFRAYRAGGKIGEIPTSWQGQAITAGEEWQIFKRFPGYWYWYKKAIERRALREAASHAD
ncbi:MAG TPA: glycosyltransferase family 2 protein [Candidatus Peribacteraceae bacterium]|nr:glycosyltransferase family 2 protein [Candidatus Peribacteraceae bacterium]